jgi:glycerate kinase
MEVRATGPLGQPVEAVIAVRDGTAVVELAQASGLQLPGGGREPLRATSFGTGQLVLAALDAGCRTVILGIGGSASTDGGAGMVQALGARLSSHRGPMAAAGGGDLVQLDSVDLSGLDPRLAATRFVLASDVDNPLLGPSGAAAVFAPQKGASASQVVELERGLRRWSDSVAGRVGHDFSTEPGAGAAGGVGFAAMALLHAESRPGIELMLQLIGFSDQLAGASLVVTGEGSLDEQSLHGKAPVGVALAAAQHGIPTVVVAGRTTLASPVLAGAGFQATHTLQSREPDLERCMSEAGPLLSLIGEQIGKDWATALR